MESSKRVKTGGRTKGTPNKITNDVRNIVRNIVERYMQKSFKKDFASLTPEIRMNVILKLLPFICAKQTEINMQPEFPTFAELLMQSMEIDDDEIEEQVS